MIRTKHLALFLFVALVFLALAGTLFVRGSVTSAPKEEAAVVLSSPRASYPVQTEDDESTFDRAQFIAKVRSVLLTEMSVKSTAEPVSPLDPELLRGGDVSELPTPSLQ